MVRYGVAAVSALVYSGTYFNKKTAIKMICNTVILIAVFILSATGYG
jgi:hypothetical protein